MNLYELMKVKFMDFIDKIIPKAALGKQLFLFLPKYLRYSKRIASGEDKNNYAILCNDIRGGNILNIPLFIQQYFPILKKLEKKIIQKEAEKRKFCAFIVSSNSSRERIDFFKKLSGYKKIDSFGKVFNNAMADVKKWKNNSEIFKNYKFVICFENSFADEYITEKLPNAMLANSIPIYRGGPNVGKYFDTKSFINYDDYGSHDAMIEKIIELDKDDRAYLKFLGRPWFRRKKMPSSIKNKEKELINFYKRIISS